MRIKYIDVLKAFAIIAVVFYHAGIMTYGYLGVDVFLVIAGYLTTRSLYSKMTAFGALNGGGQILLKLCAKPYYQTSSSIISGRSILHGYGLYYNVAR